LRFVSSGAGPGETTRCGDDAAADAVPGNFGIVAPFAEPATADETEVAPAASATAWPKAEPANVARKKRAPMETSTASFFEARIWKIAIDEPSSR
jgi:hypothetical protein